MFQGIDSYKERVEVDATAAVGGSSAIFLTLHNILQSLEMQSLETIRNDTINSLTLAAKNYAILQSAVDKIKVIKN